MLTIYKNDYGIQSKNELDAIIDEAVLAFSEYEKGNIKIKPERSSWIILAISERYNFVDKTESQGKFELYEQEKLLAQTTPSPKYAQYRLEDYIKEGLTMDRWNELVIEEDLAGQADFKARREIIRQRYPKPT